MLVRKALLTLTATMPSLLLNGVGSSRRVADSQTDYSRYSVKEGDDDTANVISAFANYDLGFVKPMVAVEYWDGGLVQENVSQFKNGGGMTKGYGIVVGATAPVLGGSFKATVGYNDYEDLADVKTYDGNNFMLGAGYEYPLSKRTSVYTAAGYTRTTTIVRLTRTTTPLTPGLSTLVSSTSSNLNLRA